MDNGRMCLASKAKAPVLRYGGTLLTYIAAFLIFDRSELLITCKNDILNINVKT